MAEVGNKFGLGAGGGLFYGAQSPKKATGRYFIPPHMVILPSGQTVTTTAARYYIAPFYVEQVTTFAGAWTINSGVGDNGDKVKIAAYSEATAGGPGALAKSFGEVTLSGASAARTFASSWSANPGWYYLEMVTDNAADFYTMSTIIQVTSVGAILPNAASTSLGIIGAPTVSSTATANYSTGDYVGGTYANFPEATSLTPATTLFETSPRLPLFGLYT